MGVKPSRPWWRKPLSYLLRVRPRPRRLRGSLLHRMLGARLFDPHLWVPEKKSIARGAAIGVFVALTPLFGVHVPLSILLGYALRANLMIAVLVTFINNPFTLGGVFWAQVKLGQWLLPNALAEATLPSGGPAKYLLVYGKPLLAGSLVSALGAALLMYPLALGGWKVMEARRETAKKRRLSTGPAA